MTSRQRLQGTDGIRARALPSSDPSLRDLSPLECLVRRQVITEQFVELYAYVHVRSLIEQGLMVEGEEFVLGWDPRDPKGQFTEAAARGVRKAGGMCASLGVFPTPGVSFYLQYRRAKGAMVITASHNLKDQNGIKIFLAPLGLKPLPADDEALTEAIYRTPFSQVAALPPRGRLADASHDAEAAFTRFLLEPANSWLEEEKGFEDTILVLDCANGACAPFAPSLFRRLGFAEVIPVGTDVGGNVNEQCGVAALEGCRFIGRDGVSDTGRDLAGHQAVEALLRLARERGRELETGERKLTAAVFDADGDRFYRLDFNPYRQMIHLLSGDEVAAHQATFLASRFRATLQGAPLVTTVESDIAFVREAASWGFTPRLTVVGDKWVLLEAAYALLDGAISASADIATPARLSTWRAALQKLRSAEEPRGQEISLLSEEIPWNQLGEHLGGTVRFAVGSEESGHTITLGSLTTAGGLRRPVFIGNGLKSAINTFAATRQLALRHQGRHYFERLAHPFPPGWKRNIYIYYTDKARLRRGTELWQAIEQRVTQACRRHFSEGAEPRMARYPQEPDLLYIGLREKSSRLRACVFCRNSGTEDKTGISLRGAREDAEKLEAIGDELRRFMLRRMKAPGNPYAQAERKFLVALMRQGEMSAQEAAGLVEGVSADRLLQEELRQELVEKDRQVYRVTEVGRWYVAGDASREFDDPGG